VVKRTSNTWDCHINSRLNYCACARKTRFDRQTVNQLSTTSTLRKCIWIPMLNNRLQWLGNHASGSKMRQPFASFSTLLQDRLHTLQAWKTWILIHPLSRICMHPEALVHICYADGQQQSLATIVKQLRCKRMQHHRWATSPASHSLTETTFDKVITNLRRESHDLTSYSGGHTVSSLQQ